MRAAPTVAAVAFLLIGAGASAQNHIGSGDVASTYQRLCASCHGLHLEGGAGASLVDSTWAHGDRDDDLSRSIRDGIEANGMPPFGGALDPGEIRAMVIYLRERAQLASAGVTAGPKPLAIYESREHDFRLEALAEVDGVFWGIAFLPGQRILLTERQGRLWLFESGKLTGPIEDTPDVRAIGQGGLLDVARHPAFEQNGWIYLSYSRPGDWFGVTAMTAVVRGRIEAGRWRDEEQIYAPPSATYSTHSAHFGSRLVFAEGHLLFTIGDRGARPKAQDLSLPNGKIHRLLPDGRIPDDNPFREVAGADPTIWSYGHRNPQGLALHPVTGEVFAAEHGPRGGDELNRILPHRNYGWPLVTYGMNYDGTAVSEHTRRDGIEDPVLYWTPSIAVSGIEFYRGGAFPRWKNDLFVAGLSARELRRIDFDGGKPVSQEVLIKGLARFRAVASGPDGTLYVLANHGKHGPSTLYRLVPASHSER